MPAKVAVIGTGLAGMTAAHHLSEKYEVSTYETAESAGMDANSMSLTAPGEATGPRIDVPVRSFSTHYYPNLLCLYQSLGASMQSVNYNQCLCEPGGHSLFRYQNFTLGQMTLPIVNPFTSGKFVAEFLLFQLRCWWWCGSDRLKTITFEEFCREAPMSSFFYEHFLLNINSSMLSCKIDTVRRYPADIIAKFFGQRETTLLSSWLRIRDGAQLICKKLLARVPQARQHYAAPVERVSPLPSGRVELTLRGGERRVYDKVVIATEAVHALKMLGDPTPLEEELMSSFKYEQSVGYVHQDASLMPPKRSEWRTNTSFVPPAGGVKGAPEGAFERASCAVWMNQVVDIPQGVGDVFQSWNPWVPPAESKQLRRAEFLRATHDVQSAANAERLGEIQGKRGVYFCGSYASRGMTLLEQAVTSSLEVCALLDCPPAWDHRNPPPFSLDLADDDTRGRNDRFVAKWQLILGAAVAAALPAALLWRRNASS